MKAPWQMNMKTIPKFENEDQERDFWAGQDSTEVVDWSKAQPVAFATLTGRRVVACRKELTRKPS